MEKSTEITIRFDGEDVPIGKYVKKIFTNTILAMADTLRGYSEGMDVEIIIKHLNKEE
ncbi:MAG: hypothetical protein FWH52_05145 [Synergistaceae bacterium]|nr:hypothetical protein [Synergistaceae bacterium]